MYQTRYILSKLYILYTYVIIITHFLCVLYMLYMQYVHLSPDDVIHQRSQHDSIFDTCRAVRPVYAKRPVYNNNSLLR